MFSSVAVPEFENSFPNWIKIAVMACAAAAICCAGFLLIARNIGTAGAHPRELRAYWHQMQHDTLVPPEDPIRAMRAELLLDRHQEAVQKSEETLTEKAAKIDMAIYFLLLGFVNFLYGVILTWLA